MSAEEHREPASKARKTTRKSAKLTHIEINVHAGKRKKGKLWIEANTIGWIPPYQRREKKPIKKTWKQFAEWIEN